MGQVWLRVKDKRVLALVKAFLKAGVMTETGNYEDSDNGTPPVVGIRFRDTRVHPRRPALAGIPLPLASPVGQSEAATAQTSSATAASAQASALSTTSVAPASR
jgi:hypothetical protein